MLKKIICLLIITCFFIITNCTQKQKIQNSKLNDKIIGLWERVGDKQSGIVVQVFQLNNADAYSGEIAYLPEKLNMYAAVGDIFWQNLYPMTSTQWEGTIIARGTDLFGENVSKNIKANFLLIKDDLLEVYTNDKTQKWIKKDKSYLLFLEHKDGY